MELSAAQPVSATATMGERAKQELQNAIDRGDYGRPLEYDANFLGPRAKRSCTDIICFLPLICFIIVWYAAGDIAFRRGNPAKMIYPIDTDGKICGYDNGVEDKKYLFYFDITKCTKDGCDTIQVCVEKCPTEVYYGAHYISNGEASTAQSKGICKGEKPSAEGMSEAMKYKHCAAWYLPLRNIGRRCIYASEDDFIDDPMYEELRKDTGLDLNAIVTGSRYARTSSQVKKVRHTIVADLEGNWPYLLSALLIAMMLCMIYVVFMRWFPGIIVWTSVIGVLTLLAFCCYATWAKYADARKDEEDNHTRDAVKITWLLFFIASCIFLVVIFLLIVSLRKRILIATSLIAEASRAVGNMSTLFFPLIPWIFQMVVTVLTVKIWVYLGSTERGVYRVQGVDNGNCSCEVYSNGRICLPYAFFIYCPELRDICPGFSCSIYTYERRSIAYDYFQAVNIIGFFWTLCFLSAFSDMALSGAFSTWYWTFRKSDVSSMALTRSVGRTVRYHLGTLAFGSLIVAICRLIRVILEYIIEQLRKYDNGFGKLTLCCCKCFLLCLEKFIKFINRNAYIMCAIHGKNFCRSSRKGFNLVMRNTIRVLVLDKVTDFLFLLGKLLITGGIVVGAFYFFNNDKRYMTDEGKEMQEYSYYLVSIMFVAIGTYFVASVFFSIYAMAVDTIFICFLEDLERNDGSAERPYYMSKNLLKILGKKNTNYMETLE